MENLSGSSKESCNRLGCLNPGRHLVTIRGLGPTGGDYSDDWYCDEHYQGRKKDEKNTVVEYTCDEQGNRTWNYRCGCETTSGGGAYGTPGSGYTTNRCETHSWDEDGNLIQD